MPKLQDFIFIHLSPPSPSNLIDQLKSNKITESIILVGSDGEGLIYEQQQRCKKITRGSREAIHLIQYGARGGCPNQFLNRERDEKFRISFLWNTHTHTHTMDSSSRVNKNRRTASRYTCVFVEFIQRKRYNVTTARTPNKFQRRHVFTLSRAYGSPPCNRGPPFSDLTFSARKTEFPRVYVYVSAWPLKYSTPWKKTSLFNSSSTSLFQDWWKRWKHYSLMNKTINEIEKNE